jgi:hypothetical protein
MINAKKLLMLLIFKKMEEIGVSITNFKLHKVKVEEFIVSQ